jgi:hypothetical protein
LAVRFAPPVPKWMEPMYELFELHLVAKYLSSVSTGSQDWWSL